MTKLSIPDLPIEKQTLFLQQIINKALPVPMDELESEIVKHIKTHGFENTLVQALKIYSFGRADGVFGSMSNFFISKLQSEIYTPAGLLSLDSEELFPEFYLKHHNSPTAKKIQMYFNDLASRVIKNGKFVELKTHAFDDIPIDSIDDICKNPNIQELQDIIICKGQDGFVCASISSISADINAGQIPKNSLGGPVPQDIVDRIILLDQRKANQKNTPLVQNPNTPPIQDTPLELAPPIQDTPLELASPIQDSPKNVSPKDAQVQEPKFIFDINEYPGVKLLFEQYTNKLVYLETLKDQDAKLQEIRERLSVIFNNVPLLIDYIKTRIEDNNKILNQTEATRVFKGITDNQEIKKQNEMFQQDIQKLEKLKLETLKLFDVPEKESKIYAKCLDLYKTVRDFEPLYTKNVDYYTQLASKMTKMSEEEIDLRIAELDKNLEDLQGPMIQTQELKKYCSEHPTECGELDAKTIQEYLDYVATFIELIRKGFAFSCHGIKTNCISLYSIKDIEKWQAEALSINNLLNSAVSVRTEYIKYLERVKKALELKYPAFNSVFDNLRNNIHSALFFFYDSNPQVAAFRNERFILEPKMANLETELKYVQNDYVRFSQIKSEIAEIKKQLKLASGIPIDEPEPEWWLNLVNEYNNLSMDMESLQKFQTHMYTVFGNNDSKKSSYLQTYLRSPVETEIETVSLYSFDQKDEWETESAKLAELVEKNEMQNIPAYIPPEYMLYVDQLIKLVKLKGELLCKPGDRINCADLISFTDPTWTDMSMFVSQELAIIVTDTFVEYKEYLDLLQLALVHNVLDGICGDEIHTKCAKLYPIEDYKYWRPHAQYLLDRLTQFGKNIPDVDNKALYTSIDKIMSTKDRILTKLKDLGLLTDTQKQEHAKIIDKLKAAGIIPPKEPPVPKNVVEYNKYLDFIIAELKSGRKACSEYKPSNDCLVLYDIRNKKWKKELTVYQKSNIQPEIDQRDYFSMVYQPSNEPIYGNITIPPSGPIRPSPISITANMISDLDTDFQKTCTELQTIYSDLQEDNIRIQEQIVTMGNKASKMEKLKQYQEKYIAAKKLLPSGSISKKSVQRYCFDHSDECFGQDLDYFVYLDLYGRALEFNLVKACKTSKVKNCRPLYSLEEKSLWKREIPLLERKFTHMGRVIKIDQNPQVIYDMLYDWFGFSLVNTNYAMSKYIFENGTLVDVYEKMYETLATLDDAELNILLYNLDLNNIVNKPRTNMFGQTIIDRPKMIRAIIDNMHADRLRPQGMKIMETLPLLDILDLMGFESSGSVRTDTETIFEYIQNPIKVTVIQKLTNILEPITQVGPNLVNNLLKKVGVIKQRTVYETANAILQKIQMQNFNDTFEDQELINLLAVNLLKPVAFLMNEFSYRNYDYLYEKINLFEPEFIVKLLQHINKYTDIKIVDNKKENIASIIKFVDFEKLNYELLMAIFNKFTNTKKGLQTLFDFAKTQNINILSKNDVLGMLKYLTPEQVKKITRDLNLNKQQSWFERTFGSARPENILEQMIESSLRFSLSENVSNLIYNLPIEYDSDYFAVFKRIIKHVSLSFEQAQQMFESLPKNLQIILEQKYANAYQKFIEKSKESRLLLHLANPKIDIQLTDDQIRAIITYLQPPQIYITNRNLSNKYSSESNFTSLYKLLYIQTNGQYTEMLVKLLTHINISKQQAINILSTLTIEQKEHLQDEYTVYKNLKVLE